MLGKSLLATAVCAVALGGVGASAAFAGEITGNGKPLWTNTTDWNAEHTLHGASACAFSGQEDLRYGPNPDLTVGHSQSWGQIPKEERDFLTTSGMNPGISCNPTKSSDVAG